MASNGIDHNSEEDDDVLELNESDVEEVIDLGDTQDGMEADSDEGDAAMQEDVDDDEAAGPDTSVAHFASHQPSAIFAIAAHPVETNLIISGGADDVAYIWRADTGEEIVRLSGHTDSVSAVGWSNDGELVATGGMDGRVRVWRRVKPGPTAPPGSEYARWEFLTSLEDGPDEVMWLAWHPKGSVLAAGSNAGAIWMWNLPSGKTMGVLSLHSTPCTAGTWTPRATGKGLLTASGAPEPTLAFWQPGSSLTEPEHKWSFAAVPGADKRFALAGGINCLATNTAGTLGLIGGQADPEDTASALRLVNLAAGGAPLGAFEGGHDPGASIEAIAWADLSANVGIWITAATDGKVCAWDGTTGKPRWVASHDGPVTSLAVIESVHGVVTGSADKTIRLWDLRSGTSMGEPRTGHRAVIHSIATTKDRMHVISGGDDGLARVHSLA